MKKIYANNLTTLSLGRQGENLARQVVFDLSAWEAEYGPGVAELIHQRSGDAQPYPLAVQRDGTLVTWDVTATDTEMDGYGKCELRYYAGETLAKSQIWRTWVESAMDTPSETAPPEPEQGWVDQVLAVGVSVKEAADIAKTYSNSAEQSASGAAQSAQEAAGSASAASTSETNAKASEVSAKASETAAQASKTAAAESASAAANSAASASAVASAASGSAAAAKASETAAAESASAAQQSATSAAESAAVYDDVVADVNQLKQDVITKADKTALAKTDRSLDALWKLNQGISYKFETDDSEAYSKTVPSGAKLASVESIGGNTVVWNQLKSEHSPITSTTTIGTESGTKIVSGHKFLISWLNNVSEVGTSYPTVSPYTKIDGSNTNIGGIVDSSSIVNGFNTVIFTSSVTAVADGSGIANEGNLWFYVALHGSTGSVESIQLFDLTQMFGYGNEPTSTDDPRIAWIKQYAAAHPEYNAGELVSADVESVMYDGTVAGNIPESVRSLPGYGWSAGDANNSIERTETGWQYVQRVGSVDLGTLNWKLDTTSERLYFQTIDKIEFSHNTVEEAGNGICTQYPVLSIIDASNYASDSISWYWYEGGKRTPVRVYDSAYTDADAFQTAISGVMLYYELADPIITDITDLMADFQESFQVEAGGTITFENAAKLTVPNSVEYVVSLAEVGSV